MDLDRFNRSLTEKEINEALGYPPPRPTPQAGLFELANAITISQATAVKIEKSLVDAWNWESQRMRNQESTTLPKWVRKALGYDIDE